MDTANQTAAAALIDWTAADRAAATGVAFPFYAYFEPRLAPDCYRFESQHFATVEQAVSYAQPAGKGWWIFAPSGALVARPA